MSRRASAKASKRSCGRAPAKSTTLSISKCLSYSSLFKESDWPTCAAVFDRSLLMRYGPPDGSVAMRLKATIPTFGFRSDVSIQNTAVRSKTWAIHCRKINSPKYRKLARRGFEHVDHRRTVRGPRLHSGGGTIQRSK